MAVKGERMSGHRALVLGAGGFIGSHLVRRLKADGSFVRGADLRKPAYSPSPADEFIVVDLRDPTTAARVLDGDFDEIYQFAADMGGAGFIFSGDNDADIMSNSAAININVLRHLRDRPAGRIFYASSACIYPAANQRLCDHPTTAEASAYPADPDSEYGWEKLFSERLYASFARNFGATVRIARYHNVFGPEGAWTDGREKAPAALCRKIALAADGGEIEIWGDGLQTRSFLYIDECIEGTLRLMRSGETGPFNIGSSEMVSINALAQMIAEAAGKRVTLAHVDGPQGVRGRTSDNALIRERLGWAPSRPLREGLEPTYRWIKDQIAAG